MRGEYHLAVEDCWISEWWDDLVFLAVCTPRFRAEAYTDIDAPDA